MTGISEADARVVGRMIDIVLERLLDGSIEQTEARDYLSRLAAMASTGTPYIAQFAEAQIAAIEDQKRRKP